MINQPDMMFKLNYTVLQVTSSRLLLEIKPLKTFSQQINANSRLIYTVSVATGSGMPVVRGTMDVSQFGADAHSRRFYLAIESLQANTTYLFAVYLKTKLNNEDADADVNYVQLVANRTFTTPVRLVSGNNSNSTTTTTRPSKLSEDEPDDDDGLIILSFSLLIYFHFT